MINEIFGGLRYTLRSMFLTYNFYHPELHLGGCVLKYARRQYPELMQAPMTTDNVVTIVRTMYSQLSGYLKEMVDENRQEVQAERERIGAKVADLTAPSSAATIQDSSVSASVPVSVPQFTPIQAPTPLPPISHQPNNPQPFQVPTVSALKYRSIRRSATGDILDAEIQDEGVELLQPNPMEINAFATNNEARDASQPTYLNQNYYYNKPSAYQRQLSANRNNYNVARHFPATTSRFVYKGNLNAKRGPRQFTDVTIEQQQQQQLLKPVILQMEWASPAQKWGNELEEQTPSQLPPPPPPPKTLQTPYVEKLNVKASSSSNADKDDSFSNEMLPATTNHIDDDNDDVDGVVMAYDGGVAEAISAGSGEDGIVVPSTLFDFENIILESFGFNAKEVKSFSLARCAQSYVLNIMWRMVEGYLG